jgi:hypothetical protein
VVSGVLFDAKTLDNSNRTNHEGDCPMRDRSFVAFLAFLAISLVASQADDLAQESTETATQRNADSGASGFIVGHPFAATKYARRVKALPEGKEQFIANERYPIKIARDEKGRIMMQKIGDELLPECDQLKQHDPPPCPAWGIFVIDPVARTDTHWLEGERAYHGAVAIPLSQDQLEEAAHVTSEMPELAPDIDTDASSVTTMDLGNKTIEGILAHGVRTTVIYPVGHTTNKAPVTWIHEAWIAPEMKLIVRVVEGYPSGEETVWGLERISLSPDSALFQPPGDYELQHRKNSIPWTGHDFETLKAWFAK